MSRFRRSSPAVDEIITSVEEPGQLQKPAEGGSANDEGEVRLPVSFPKGMMRDIDKARKKGGGLSKAAFIRQCVDEGLRKRGF